MRLRHGIRLKQMLMPSVLIAVMSLGLMTACGSGGDQTGSGTTVLSNSNASPAVIVPSNADQTKTVTDSFTVTYDEYGLTKPNFFYSTNNDSFWSIQADVAENVWDPNFKTVMRIDIAKTSGTMPDIGGKVFAIEDNTLYEKFPGAFIVLNGEKSTLKKVKSGTITFTQDSTLSGDVNGTFDVMLTDYDSTISPTPHYHLMGTFSFKIGTYGAAAS